MKKTGPISIGEYLAAVPADKRAALQKLRKAIRAAAPQAQECRDCAASCSALAK